MRRKKNTAGGTLLKILLGLVLAGAAAFGIGAGYHKLDEMEKRITVLEEAQAVQQGDIKDAGGRVETLEKRTRSLARSVKKLETGTLSVSAEEGTLSPPSGNAEILM